MKSLKKPGFNFSLDALKLPALALGVLLILAGLGSLLISGFDTPTRILLAVGILVLGMFVAIDPETVWGRLTAPGALYSGNTLLLAVAIVGILGLINVVANNRHQRWDLTANKQYSLSDQTLKVLSDLPQPVQVTAFYQDEDSRKREAQDLLAEYQSRSNARVSAEFVDPDREPARAQQAGVKEYGTTLMTMGDRRQTVTGSRESDFTTALLRLMNPTQKKIYFTIGHNERKIDGFERDSYGQLKTSLESDNYIVEPLVLAGSREVPPDAALVVIAQPRNPFGEDEKQAIQTYLDIGGKLMVLTQPNLPPSQQQVPLSDLVGKWSIAIGSAPVAEGNPQLSSPREPLVFVVATYPNHKITEGLGLTLFPTATHITVPRDTPREATITPILQTSDRSWAETDLQQLRFDEGTDAKGPLTIGVAIDARPENAPPASPGGDQDQPDKKTRVVIFGDADFVSNEAFNLASNNRDLFLNAANWLAEEEQLIAIRPKERESRNLFLTAAQQNLVLFSSTLFLPLIVLGLGGLVWWSRR
jgi:ABC-type uncharacterized transport system involved in gliding motility auxiliary subunit